MIPFDFLGISLWLAMTAVILLITTVLFSAYDGKSMILIDQKRLRFAAFLLDILFLATVLIRIVQIATSV